MIEPFPWGFRADLSRNESNPAVIDMTWQMGLSGCNVADVMDGVHPRLPYLPQTLEELYATEEETDDDE